MTTITIITTFTVLSIITINITTTIIINIIIIISPRRQKLSWALKDGFYEIGEEEEAGQAGRMREGRRRLGKQRIPGAGSNDRPAAEHSGKGRLGSAVSSLVRAWSLPSLLLHPDSWFCPSFPWTQMLYLCLGGDPLLHL